MDKLLDGTVVMSSKEIPEIANYADLHLSPIRKLHISIEVLDKNNKPIATVQGLSTGGNLSVSGDSLIRRTGDLSFVLFEDLLPREGSILWMTNKIRVYAGLENMSSVEGEITHFCIGTFYITEPSIQIDRSSREISISLQDNMMKWEQEELENKLVIEADTPLNIAVEELMNAYGEWNTNVEFTDLKVPYKLEFEIGEDVMSILTKLRDLYMDWECYYDVDGTLIFKKSNIQLEGGEPVSWSFDKGSDLLTTFKESFTYKNVKNRVLVIGQMDSKGITPRAEATIIDEGSQFHSSKIDVRTKVITDSTLTNNMQCSSKARYELFQASTFQEQLDIDTIPIYYLDAGDLIEVRNLATNELEKYVIDSIGIGLGIEDEMSLGCHKVYYNQFETIGSSLGDYQKSADLVINGIENLGWLALAEDRVKEYYGLEGDGSPLHVRFIYEQKYGVTAYTTGYFGDKAQSLTIDLADFANSTGENGDNGQTKAEYSDRILGHEMVHAIMNNALTIEKTSGMPDWFKEGSAEFIHGADERLKASIVKEGGTSIDSTLLNGLINRSVELMNGASFKSETDDYSAGYIVLKYLDKNLTQGKTMKDFMYFLKVSNQTGVEAVKEAIVNATPFTSYDAFVASFKNGAYNYIKTGVHLNIGSDEADTGSIGGIDHRGTVALNAEDVFDESKAQKGVSAKGFKVDITRP
ncbi:hypothetical protein P4639_22570 [Priestia megaterium]|uniref:hypothetical protein n=1 Tax=Priestia megaterium TaxID=1404 RepID=UPI002E1AECF3|nr:hypothetical protein [Priestia megaterium]